MEWSKEYPKSNGYYWFKGEDGQPTVVSVWDINDGLREFGAMVAFVGTDFDKFLIETKGLWAGPLTPPEKD